MLLDTNRLYPKLHRLVVELILLALLLIAAREILSSQWPSAGQVIRLAPSGQPYQPEAPAAAPPALDSCAFARHVALHWQQDDHLDGRNRHQCSGERLERQRAQR